MKVSRTAAQTRRPRPSRVPLPSLHAAERVRGAGILEECAGNGCGMVLWESFRNVTDWAATPREQRGDGLFGAGAAERRTAQLGGLPGMERDLRTALGTIRDLLADPGAADPRAVAAACGTVASWAALHGRPTTRFYFTAAAALCVPEDARQAYQAGCAARDLARWDAAEQWLEYAVATAKRGRDRATQAVSLLGIGNTFYRQGFYQRARDVQRVGLTLAQKHRLHEMQARAHHDLFITAAEMREPQQAEQHARMALQAYGATHQNVPALAHDVARFWLELGRASRAFTVLTALLPRMKNPVHRLFTLASLGWAAGGCGRRDIFERVWSDAWTAASAPAAGAAAASALLQLAYGATYLGDDIKARAAATAAIRIAGERGETEEMATGTAFLESMTTGPRPMVPPVHAVDGMEEGDGSFADELAHTLVAG